MARDLGLQIPPPITSLIGFEASSASAKTVIKTYLVDELQIVLNQLNDETATLDENYKEMVRMFGVKETCCTKCSHRDVCQYKEEYLAAQALWMKSVSTCPQGVTSLSKAFGFGIFPGSSR